jgi:hypothetical protein
VRQAWRSESVRRRQPGTPACSPSGVHLGEQHRLPGPVAQAATARGPLRVGVPFVDRSREFLLRGSRNRLPGPPYRVSTYDAAPCHGAGGGSS